MVDSELGTPAPATLSPVHLHALVLIEAGERRWQMGLTGLAARLYISRELVPFSDLERWGFVADVADDERWEYYLAPTILGQSYLRRCPEAGRVRTEVWAREIDLHEVPDEVDPE